MKPNSVALRQVLLFDLAVCFWDSFENVCDSEGNKGIFTFFKYSIIKYIYRQAEIHFDSKRCDISPD